MTVSIWFIVAVGLFAVGYLIIGILSEEYRAVGLLGFVLSSVLAAWMWLSTIYTKIL